MKTVPVYITAATIAERCDLCPPGYRQAGRLVNIFIEQGFLHPAGVVQGRGRKLKMRIFTQEEADRFIQWWQSGAVSPDS